jgi:uncharacterized glyoxalase superfamily protein PhnB
MSGFVYIRAKEMKRICRSHLICCTNVGGAVKFLRKVFGLVRAGEQMKGPDGKLTHASMKLGDDFVMMGWPGKKYKNPKRLGQATQSLYVNVDNVDKHFARAKKAGAKILEEPADTFYGHRRYGAEDPEGHQWYFAQEIAKRATSKKS